MLRVAQLTACQLASQEIMPSPTHVYCPVKVFSVPWLPSSKPSVSLSSPDRTQRVSFLLLTRHHPWVGTGAWAAGYKRPEGLRSMPPHPPPKSLLTLCLDCQFREPVELFLSGAARMTLSRTVTGVITCYRHVPQTYSTEQRVQQVTRLNKTKSCTLTFIVVENCHC